MFLRELLWGPGMVAALVGTGALLTVCASFPQVTLLGRIRGILRLPGRDAQVSPRQALCTALAATVGTGNIVGVAGAICLGGPGAVFWMWVSGFFGMATKFAEVALAERFAKGAVGGPMYTIERGLPGRYRFLAVCYCVFGLGASFGVGNATQIGAVVDGAHQVLGLLGIAPRRGYDFLLGLLLAACVGAVLIGGVKRIGQAAERLVPGASLGYVLLCLMVLLFRRENLFPAVRSIFLGAFSPGAFTGGAVGSAAVCLSVGCARGVFSNEAGMGTASMAYMAAPGESVEKGILGLFEVLTDTLVICTLTALAILCAGVDIAYGVDAGGSLAPRAFGAVLGPWAVVLLTLFLCVFAFATVLGWGLYGARCGEYLFGPRFLRVFPWLQMAGVLLGATLESQRVWLLAECFNALMAVPNLAALFFLRGELRALVTKYKKKE